MNSDYFNEMLTTEPIERGCGTRKEDGAYFCVTSSPFGGVYEWRDLLVDPIKDMTGLDIPAVGIHEVDVFMYPDNSYGFLPTPDSKVITLFFDIVGKEHYETWLDFYMEASRFGLSRRCELTDSQLAKINENSLYVLAHRDALILNASEYAERYFWGCPQKQFNHLPDHYRAQGLTETCAGMARHMMIGEPTDNGERVMRTLPSGYTYYGHPCPDDFIPQTALGIFMAIPIQKLGHFEVVRGNHSEETVERVSKFLPVVEVEA